MALWTLVAEARKRAGLTQSTLAQRVGIEQRTLARIESGDGNPSAALVERLVQAAGFEMRVSLGEPDPGTTSLLERGLRRTPAERLAGAVQATRFVQKGRAALRASDDA